jgi:hypothetical protein
MGTCAIYLDSGLCQTYPASTVLAGKFSAAQGSKVASFGGVQCCVGICPGVD